MSDYLQPAGKFWRIACCIASGVASIMFLFGATILWASMLREWKFTFDGKPLWLGAIFLTVVGCAAAFVTLRLARETGAAIDRTTLPVRFIQVFGVLFVAGIGAVAYDKKDLLFGLRALPAGLAMILVSKNIARRRKKAPNQPTEQTAPSGRGPS